MTQFRELVDRIPEIVGNAEGDRGPQPDAQPVNADVRLSSLRGLIDSGLGDPEDFIELGSLLLSLDNGWPTEGFRFEGVTRMRAGVRRHPDAVRILELWVMHACRIALGEYVAAMRQLQVKDPSSKVLHLEDFWEVFMASPPSGLDGMLNQAMNSIAEADQGADVGADLGLIGRALDLFPRSASIRTKFAIALGSAGDLKRALGEAQATTEIGLFFDHAIYYNLGMVFGACGETSAALDMSTLAYRHADTDADRSDAEGLSDALRRGAEIEL
jgi:hypothetical protein